jgi:hypothetical protein
MTTITCENFVQDITHPRTSCELRFYGRYGVMDSRAEARAAGWIFKKVTRLSRVIPGAYEIVAYCPACKKQ